MCRTFRHLDILTTAHDLQYNTLKGPHTIVDVTSLNNLPINHSRFPPEPSRAEERVRCLIACADERNVSVQKNMC